MTQARLSRKRFSRGSSVALLALAAVAAGCGQREKMAKLENKVAQLEQERAELQQYVSDQDAHAIEIANAVDDVLTRVTELTARHGRLRLRAGEAELGGADEVATVREAILEELSWLDLELAANRERLTQLNQEIAGLEGEGSRQAARVVQLEKMIDTQELLIKDLRLDAEKLEARAARLAAEKDQVEEEKVAVEADLQELAQQHQELRSQYDTLEGDVGRGYILVGDKQRIKELKKLDVLQERGKVLVAGSAVTTTETAAEHFMQVPVVAREIKLGQVSERLEILSPHREQGENFWIERKGDELYLMLRDPGLFWSASHYLVLRER